MIDALGNKLTLGQRVAIPCNSKFVIGILIKYKPNNSKWYLDAVEWQRTNSYPNQWTERYYSKRNLDNMENSYYVRLPNDRIRKLNNRESIISIQVIPTGE